MDRHFSSSLGVPMTTQDSDISTLLELPATGRQQDATFIIQVRLWRLFSTIVTSVYCRYVSFTPLTILNSRI
jgi:proline utilization trans-activator